MGKAKQEKLTKRAFENLARMNLLEAESNFKRAKCHGGLALVAFLAGRFERSANQALRSLNAGERCFPDEREVVSKILKLCREKIEKTPLIEQIKKRISEVKWGEVEEKIDALAKIYPEIFARLRSSLVPREVKDRKLGHALKALKLGSLDRCLEILSELAQTCPDDEFLGYGWATDPELIGRMRMEIGKKAFELEVTRLVELSKKPTGSREISSFMGLWLSNFGFYYLKRGEVQKSRGVLHEALRCFENSTRLGEKSAFAWAVIGFCHEWLGNTKRAIRCYERAYEAPVDAGIPRPTCGETLEQVSEGEEKSTWYRIAGRRAEACLLKMEREFFEHLYHKLIKRAEKARVINRTKREIRLLEEALDIRPRDFELLAPRMAELKIKLRRKVGLDFLRAALKHDPKNRAVLKHVVKKGVKLFREKKPRKALLYFKIVPQDHEDQRFLSTYAQALEVVKRYKDAVRVYKKLAPKDPKTFYAIARCTTLLGDVDEAMKGLQNLFSFCSDSAILEKGLKLASGIGVEKVTSEFCQRLLARDPNNPTARAIRERIQSMEMDRLRSEYTGVKTRAQELFARGDYEGVAARLSRIPEEFMEQPFVEMMAESFKEMGRYSEALRWYGKLPENVRTATSMLFCLLEEGRYPEASRSCQRLLEMGETGTLLEEIHYPGVRGFIWEELGKLEKALEEYSGEGQILHLSEKAREAGNAEVEILCFEKLYRRFSRESYRKMVKKLVLENEDKLTVGFKSRTSFDGAELVVCDTNIFFSKLLEELDFPDPIKNLSVGRKRVVQKFNEISGRARMVLSRTVEHELKRLCYGILDKLGDEYREPVTRKLDEYIKRYHMDIPTGDDKWLKKVMEFYQQYPEKLQEITEKKIEVAPDERFRLLKKRTAWPLLDSRLQDPLTLASQHLAPERADMRLLAECLELNNSPIRGVSRISLFSEDADFREFAGEIFTKFGIEVYH